MRLINVNFLKLIISVYSYQEIIDLNKKIWVRIAVANVAIKTRRRDSLLERKMELVRDPAHGQ